VVSNEPSVFNRNNPEKMTAGVTKYCESNQDKISVVYCENTKECCDCVVFGAGMGKSKHQGELRDFQ